jgi:dihydrofolate synthase/folylpolyglutamate synthase
MIEAALRKSGSRTGLFTSPHLVEPTERIRINGVPVSAERFTWAFDIVHRCAEELIRRGVLEFHPTYFETVTAMAFVLFRDEAVDSIVLEVGLGGRLDATNVVNPALTVITPVDFDHEAYLGKSLESIAGEKAGILKPGVPAIIARQRSAADVTIAARAADLGVTIQRTTDWRVEDLELTRWGSRFTACGPRKFSIRCPLAGEHQVENALAAVLALHTLGVPAEAIEQGIETAQWPGRLEKISGKPEILLDGAHNPAGTRALAAHLRLFFADRNITLIYGAMRDKALEESADVLFPIAHAVILTAPNQPRAVHPEALQEICPHPRLRIAPRLADALGLIVDADLVVITGSLFLVGEARALLVK